MTNVNVKIKGKKYTCLHVFDTKKEAFDRAKSIANNTSVCKTDDGKFALFVKAFNVTNVF